MWSRCCIVRNNSCHGNITWNSRSCERLLFRQVKKVEVVTIGQQPLSIAAVASQMRTPDRMLYRSHTQPLLPKQQRSSTHHVLLSVFSHSLVKYTNTSSRYQTTSTLTTTKSNNNIDDKEEEERLLENTEEIVDVPSSALNEVIDRSKYTDPIPIPMPDLDTSRGSDSHSSVKEWFFKTGDIIQHEDVLCDIVTPDFTFGMETDDEGVTIMGDILVPAGQTVPNGTILCYTLHESKGIDHNQLSDGVMSKVEEDDDVDNDVDAKKGSDSEKSKP